MLEGDDAMLTRVPGVGKKTAQKIVLELRGSIDLQKMVTTTSNTEVIDALVSLGYGAAEARTMAVKLPTHLLTLEDKIRAVLQTS